MQYLALQWQLVLETAMTFTLVYVVLATTTSKNYKIAPMAGIAIGLNAMFGGYPLQINTILPLSEPPASN